MNGHVMIVDDDRDMCELIEADLMQKGLSATWRTNADEAFQALGEGDFDVVLTDLRMPGVSGLELCRKIVANRPDIPVVVITAFGSFDTAVSAIRAGAYDFVTKPIEMDLLSLTLERAVNHHKLQEKVKLLSEELEQTHRFEELIGESPAMQSLYDKLSRIGNTEASILVTGESGTGKELVARAIHRQSPRSEQTFVAVNCASLPETLLESELFGHARGAFTDAKRARKGLFAQATGGTLFLDEIGDFPMHLQVKLLRTLEEQTVRPVGEDTEYPIDVRIITATNRDLETSIEEGRFREDLYFRVNVIQVDLPPLRARGADILLIAQHYLEAFSSRAGKKVSEISKPVAEKLLSYNWPGNVRELRNAMERAVALTRYERVTVEDLPEKIRAYRSSHILLGSTDPGELISMDEVEKRYIFHVLDMVGGNRTNAAKVLGLDRKTLYRKLVKYGMELNSEV